MERFIRHTILTPPSLREAEGCEAIQNGVHQVRYSGLLRFARNDGGYNV